VEARPTAEVLALPLGELAMLIVRDVEQTAVIVVGSTQS
jgi:hypothetical protein